jgi:hypothetical protein
MQGGEHSFAWPEATLSRKEISIKSRVCVLARGQAWPSSGHEEVCSKESALSCAPPRTRPGHNP